MKSQLVLQWCEPNLPDFDQLIAIEESLIAVIDQYGEIDGHDVGAGQCDIFIETHEPMICFDALRLACGGESWFATLAAGYRRLDEQAYKPVWPAGMVSFKLA